MASRTTEQISESVAKDAITKIERQTLAAGMSLEDSARVCREVAQEIRQRAEMFDDEAGAM